MNEQIQKEHPMVIFRRKVESMRPEFAKVLPPSISPQEFARVAITAVANSPGILNCTEDSVWRALMKAAEDGLLPDGREGAVVPHRRRVNIDGRWEDILEAQWFPMVGGMRKLLWQSAGIIVTTGVVYKRDQWDYVRGDEDKIIHRPQPGPRSEDDVVAVYSIARFKDGRVDRDWMWKEEVDQIKAKARSERGPWSDPVFYPEMATKTVLKHHFKSLPSSPEVERAANRDNFLYGDTSDQKIAEIRHHAEGVALIENKQAVPMEPIQSQRTVEGVLNRIEGANQAGQQAPQQATRKRRTKAEIEADNTLAAKVKADLEATAKADREARERAAYEARQAELAKQQVQEDPTGGQRETYQLNGRIVIKDKQGDYFSDTGELVNQERHAHEAAEAAGKAPAAPDPGFNTTENRGDGIPADLDRRPSNGAQVTQAPQTATTQNSRQLNAAALETFNALRAIMKELENRPISSKQEYLDHIERLLEQVQNANQHDAVRNYVTLSAHDRSRFGVTTEELKSIADHVEMRKRR